MFHLGIHHTWPDENEIIRESDHHQLNDQMLRDHRRDGGLLQTTSLTAERHDLQEQRRGLVKDYRNLLVRIAEYDNFELPPVMLRELTATKDSVTNCALDAPDTARSLFSDFSEFLASIGVMLDNRDARALEVAGRKRARSSTSPDYPGGAFSSGSDRERPVRSGHSHSHHDSRDESQHRLHRIQKVQNGSPGIDGDEERPQRPVGRRQRRVRQGESLAAWTPCTDADRQHYTFFILWHMVRNSPPARPGRNYRNLDSRTGNWKYETMLAYYTAAFPARKSPKSYWSNGYLPGGLEMFWLQA